MPEWRKLHTRITRSDDVNELPDDFCRLLWSWLPLACDSAGRCRDNNSLLRGTLFPLRTDVTVEHIQAALDAFASRRMIIRYEVAGRRYFYLPQWETYQGTPEKRREARPECPEPTADTVADDSPSQSRPSPELVASESPLERQDKSRETRAEAAPEGAGVCHLSNSDRALLETYFVELTQIPTPSTGTERARRSAGQSWWTPLREIAALVECDVGKTQQLIAETWERLDGQVTVSCPRSLVKTATAIAAEWRRDNGASGGPRVEF
jgi:hypothetical protein